MTSPLLETSLTPTLTDLVDRGSFQEVLNNYHRLFDLTVRVFDRSSALISEAMKPLDACRYFGRGETGKKQCIATRMKVKKALPEERRLLSVDCPSGLRYTLAPISFQGEVIGKLVLGPYRPEDPSRNHDEHTDDAEFTAALKSVRAIPSGLIRKIAASMLSVLDAILFSAHKALLTSEMHIATVRESFDTINKKNRELETMNERMKEFDRLKSSFLSTISHELRTPLTSIIGYSDLLSEGIAGALDREQQQFVDTIKVKGEELLKLISAILDFSQIETGHLTLNAEAVSLVALIETVIGKTKENAEKRGIRILSNVADDLENAFLDKEKIQSALSHLIDNAIKFSPPGSIVTVSARVSDAKSGDSDDDDAGFVLMASPRQLTISVQDFGEGIAPGNEEVIFSPFTQLDDSTTREHGGAGLGLALVKQFVEAHGGTISVVSTPNEGSEFTIRLPLAPE